MKRLFSILLLFLLTAVPSILYLFNNKKPSTEKVQKQKLVYPKDNQVILTFHPYQD